MPFEVAGILHLKAVAVVVLSLPPSHFPKHNHITIGHISTESWTYAICISPCNSRESQIRYFIEQGKTCEKSLKSGLCRVSLGDSRSLSHFRSFSVFNFSGPCKRGGPLRKKSRHILKLPLCKCQRCCVVRIKNSVSDNHKEVIASLSKQLST